MKFFACVLTAVVFMGVAASSRLSTKYLPPNYSAVAAAGSSRYSHYHIGNDARAGVSTGHAVSQHAQTRAGHQIPILRNEYSNDGNGNYNFGFEAGNGIKRDESGHFQGSWPESSLKVAGSYSYTGDDGKLYSVHYKADSNGFHAEGDHLPTPPPIPREIQETLHLHQHGGRQRDSAASYASAARYSTASNRNYAAAGHLPANNVLAPNANYLPPQHGQGYRSYDRHH